MESRTIQNPQKYQITFQVSSITNINKKTKYNITYTVRKKILKADFLVKVNFAIL